MATALLAMAVLAVALLSAYGGSSTTTRTTTLFRTSTTTQTVEAVGAVSTTTSTVTSYYCGGDGEPIPVSGTTYCALDVSDEAVVNSPGYAYLKSGPLEFMGVVFKTSCPSVYAGCPVPQNATITTQTTLYAGAIRFNMTFPDGSAEAAGAVIGDSQYLAVTSQHTSPRAGILLEFGPGPNDVVASTSNYHVFLLVSY
jgi:hypothetical protein